MTSRRDFLRNTVVGGALLGAVRPISAMERLAGPTQAPLDLLILGGTGFIGPHLVRHAVERGHRVTIFTRGRRAADLPDSVIRLTGDRNGQLGALEGKRWDVVIDDSATDPDWVRQSTALLRSSVSSYLFTSSTGVYYPYLKRGVDESVQPHLEIVDPKDGSESYGVQKAQSEQVVLKAFGNRGLVVRPAYIIGPGDTTDRFPYWPQRLERGGETLAPGRPDDRIAIIDVRDLAAFMVKLVEDRQGGVYNTFGPRTPMSFGEFLDRSVAALSSNAKLVWVDDHALLREHGIFGSVPWIMLDGNNFGHTHIQNGRAMAAGLTIRPLEQTVRDALAWWHTVPAERTAKPRFAITDEKEAAVLAAWRARR
ncbi:MAG: NAD-dependent epimerase/dehydratase family protein [Gemmatimonadaceae bacterium]